MNIEYCPCRGINRSYRDCLLLWIDIRLYHCDATPRRSRYSGWVTLHLVWDDIVMWNVRKREDYRPIILCLMIFGRGLRRRAFETSRFWRGIVLSRPERLVRGVYRCLRVGRRECVLQRWMEMVSSPLGPWRVSEYPWNICCVRINQHFWVCIRIPGHCVEGRWERIRSRNMVHSW